MSRAYRPDPPATCVHIGQPKAASTTLQRHLFFKHSGLDYLGKVQKFERRTPNIHALIKHLDQAQSDETLREWKQLADEVSRPGSNDGRLRMVSREMLCGGGYEGQQLLAENIERVFGCSKIVLVTRHPIAQVESMYFQRLASSVRGRDRGDGLSGYFTIEDWLQAEWARTARGDISVVLSQQILETHVAAFGRANVGVFLFEQLQQDATAFFTGICEFIGIDPEEGVRAASAEHAHPRIAASSVERLKEVWRSPSRRDRFERGTRRDRRDMLGIDHSKPPTKGEEARIDLPTEWSERIEDFAREECRYLKKEWGLAVDEHGYPL